MAFYAKFAHYYQLIFPFQQPVFDFLHGYLKPGQNDILDIGCATGHYAAAFASKGYRTTGIDLDAAMIEFAKDHYVQPTFYVLNMLDIQSLQQQFDFIFCIGNTAAHLNHTEFDILVQSVYNILRPGGIWIFQVRNWDYVVQQKEYTFPIIAAEKGRIRFTRTYSKITSDNLQFNTQLVAEEKNVFEDSLTMYPFPSHQYIEAHQNCRFQFIDHFSDYRRSPYHPDQDSANIFVFQK